MRLTWKRAGVGMAGLFVTAFAVVASGILPLKASSDHWPVTRWFLDFAMRRSVATHSLGTTVPELEDPALVLRGGGHYEVGCAPCHGRPLEERSEIVMEMTPHPPLLPETLEQWSPAELFYIVRHGIKFTAMPAWPVPDRDDEVWAMVAFLRVMPELDAAQYDRLAGVEPAGRRVEAGGGDAFQPTVRAEPGETLQPPAGSPSGTPGPGAAEEPTLSRPPAPVRESCARCHGVEGRGRGLGAFPSLAGQRAAYLEESLLAYARGDRISGTMHAVASTLSPEAMRTLATYFEEAGGGGPAAEAAAETPADSVADGVADVLVTAEADSTVRSGIVEALRRARLESGEAGTTRTEGGRSGSGASAARGEEIARRGVPDRKIPACVACHGPGEVRRNPRYPLLAGQYPTYLVEQLRLFRAARRGGTAYAGLMHVAVRGLDDEQLQDLAAYYTSLGRR